MSRHPSISCARTRRAPLAKTHRSARILINGVSSPAPARAQDRRHAVPRPALPNKRSQVVKSGLLDHLAMRYKYQA